MITIFNKKLDKSIQIDETIPKIGFMPREYELENPHVRIKLPGFDFLRHAATCKECGAFKNDFGSDSIDWFISYLGKTYRLDLRRFSSKYYDNLASHKNSIDFFGTELKLNLDTSTIEDLKRQLESELRMENFEACCIIRDKITSLP